MKRKDYGPLLALNDGKSRPARRASRRGGSWTIPKDIALPSLAELLRIDRTAEAEAARARLAIAGRQMRQKVLFVTDATNETKSRQGALCD